ncbi:DUF3427 domain-containing protein [Nesterenkonia sp.]|uniref:DUF3427 domain-containing protein n=1 Tax=Nesterenkonia sp. TaxID=704201 RepID=UPI003452EDFD
MLRQDLYDFHGEGVIVTGTYNTFNPPRVFYDLLRIQEQHPRVKIRVHNADAFHPKGYIFRQRGSVTALIGSSNLTATALTKNHEWNLKVSAATQGDLATQIDRLTQDQLAASIPLSEEWIESYSDTYSVLPPSPWPLEVAGDQQARGAIGTSTSTRPGRPEIRPNSMQKQALAAIQEMRDRGCDRAVVISATGTGKTILSALDVASYSPRRFLFLVHREQIIDRAIAEYKKVLGGRDADYGKVVGRTRETDAKYVFSTIQTFSRYDVLSSFGPDTFDYVLIDEVHRAGAATYQQVLAHLKPPFLLGITATPERTDGFNIFELFDYNVAYEIRLHDALEADMLSPFHYYGVSEATFTDGTTIDADASLDVLTGQFRVDHLLSAIAKYSQQGVQTQGLIFCSRKDEARRLSDQLNQRRLNGQMLRTKALTGDDSSAERARAVEQLRAGELDYLLTVDIFNEGVDIPSVNQVIMLRQTQSAIIFVQQLGRGLRKAPGKDHLTVIDFIGNYANNYMIPIALFGDRSLNKESMRKSLTVAEEDGFLAGLSSVHFDEVARRRVFDSIATARLDSLRDLKREIELIEQRVGRVPQLRDFWEQQSVDPVVLATRQEHYPALLHKVRKVDPLLTPGESRMLHLLSHEVLPAKRLHEFVLLVALLEQKSITKDELLRRLHESGLLADELVAKSVIDTFTLDGYNAGDRARYQDPLAFAEHDGTVWVSNELHEAYHSRESFRRYVDDLIWTGKRRNASEYRHDRIFTPGSQYSRRDVCRLLGWARSNASTIYGYRTDVDTGVAPIFVTLHKGDDVEASVAYDDALLDPSTMRWYTRSRRTLRSGEVSAIVNNEVDVHVFVQRDDAEGTGFYYLGQAHAESPDQTTMPGKNGEPLDVVRMLLKFEEPIDHSLFEYFHPTLTG